MLIYSSNFAEDKVGLGCFSNRIGCPEYTHVCNFIERDEPDCQNLNNIGKFIALGEVLSDQHTTAISNAFETHFSETRIRNEDGPPSFCSATTIHRIKRNVR